MDRLATVALSASEIRMLQKGMENVFDDGWEDVDRKLMAKLAELASKPEKPRGTGSRQEYLLETWDVLFKLIEACSRPGANPTIWDATSLVCSNMDMLLRDFLKDSSTRVAVGAALEFDEKF